MKKVKLYLNYAGYCVAKESEVIQGGKSENVQFNALWGLIEHPEKGWILYDTGYTRRFHRATSWFPNKIYALLSPVVIDEQDEVKAQLQRAGIAPEDIQHVIVTHFHADHVGGLRDFPNATFYASRQALDYTLSLS
jgi:glyoxylase-like metal-dependent hydrolase (beta-lactamase superfamily II)